MLADSYGRIATDLRISLTDRCNLRCAYCMPAEGLVWLPRPAVLTDDEVVRLARIGVESLGITEIRFTGGEPLLRRGLPNIVARTAALRPRPEISLTTNGIGLDRLAAPLHAARRSRPIPLVVSEISGLGRSAAVRATMSGSPRRSSGSPPVNRISVIPSDSTPILASRTTSSSVSSSGRGSQSRPSAGMQYAQRRLHRSVREIRRSVAILP